MGKKPGGAGAGWLATVRKVFKPASKDLGHANKQVHNRRAFLGARKILNCRYFSSCVLGFGIHVLISLDYWQKGGGVDACVGGGEAADEVVSIEHCFPAAETSPEVTNDDEGIGGVVWLEREDYFGEVVGARRGRERHGLAAASRVVVRMAAARGREERAAVRIQAFYRGYLVGIHCFASTKFHFFFCVCVRIASAKFDNAHFENRNLLLACFFYYVVLKIARRQN